MGEFAILLEEHSRIEDSTQVADLQRNWRYLSNRGHGVFAPPAVVSIPGYNRFADGRLAT